MSERVDLQQLLEDLIDPMPCAFDHHGYCQPHGWLRDDRPCPQRRILATLAEEHSLHFADDGWSLVHPVSCRPDLNGCPVRVAIAAEAAKHEGPWLHGDEYEVGLVDGQLVYLGGGALV